MKKFQKVLFVSAALSALIAPLSALEVVKDDDKSLEVYGSIRGYVGYGASMGSVSVSGPGASASADMPSYGTALYSLQTNSRIGIKTQVGNIKATAEIGFKEQGSSGHFRHLWGSYSFGSAGTLLFGKTDTPSVPAAMFASDVANTDQGTVGFGGMSTANRRLQIAYDVAGLKVALVDDTDTQDAMNSQNELIPRLAASYSYKGEELDVQVGGSYKYYNKGVRAAQGGPGGGEMNDRFVGGSGSAFHVYAAAKSQMLEKKLYVSGMLHYGMNADLYGEQRTNMSKGNYAHTQFLDDTASGDVHRVGGYVESGYSITDVVGAVLGVGYQYSGVSLATKDAASPIQAAHTYMVMAQLPIKLQKGFSITPQVGWYGAIQTSGESGQASSSTSNNGLLVLARLRYDF